VTIAQVLHTEMEIK